MDITARFKAYKDLNREIDLEIERLERLEVKAASPTPPVLSGMPLVHGGAQQHRIEESIARISELKTEIKELMERRDAERKVLDALICRLHNPDKRLVLRLRYFDAEEWESVFYIMFGGNEDFSEKYDSYKQRVFRYHKAALRELENISE